ncbi:MAG: PAS domain S-box protein, partial [Cyclobacteriaceae bacterium]|nr:PAS domain S-box protein [Cyclobacteriaceae bacterium]
SQKFADILGLPYKHVMRPDFRLDDHIHPEDREKVVRANIRAFKTLTDFHCEFRIIRPTGEIRYLDASSRPNKEENGNIFWYGVVLDVTDRKLTEEARRKTEEQLRESEFNYRLLAENIEVPHAIVNGDGEWLFINDQMAMVFGHTRVTIPRDVWQKSLPPAEWEKRKTALLYMLETGHRMTDEVPFMVQGEERWYRRIFQPIMTGGVRTQVLITGYDITEERKERERQRQYAAELELKVKERTQELVSALSKEHELAELKSKFVATTSHEFRTPLATINMSAGFLRRYKSRLTDDMLDGKLEVIERQVLHMSRLLDDILMLGRSDAGILSVQRVHLPLSELVEEIVSTMREAWKGKLVNVKVSSKRDSTYTDEKLLRSIITNLLSNALKFSPIGKAVDLTVTCDEKWLGIMVVDEGLGIPLSEQAHLFQPFQRASNVSTIQGTGLGLSIVKRSVELLGGTVAFESQENVGTTFQVQLPAGYPG